MKIEQQLNFVVINKHADSLHSLIADEEYRATSLGRNTWKTLIGSQGSLQTNCNKEGFNIVSRLRDYSKARVGILGNDNNDCKSCDSRIGFGTGGYWMTLTRVETWLRSEEIMESSTLRRWDLFWLIRK